MSLELYRSYLGFFFIIIKFNYSYDIEFNFGIGDTSYYSIYQKILKTQKPHNSFARWHVKSLMFSVSELHNAAQLGPYDKLAHKTVLVG